MNVTEPNATFRMGRLTQGHRYALRISISKPVGPGGYGIPEYTPEITFKIRQTAFVTIEYPKNNAVFPKGAPVKAV